MLRYETLFLAVPEITKDEATTLEKQFDELVTGVRGKMLSFERWGKYHLSYPIANNDYGVYFLTRFEVAAEQSKKFLDDLRAFFSIKHGNLVKRNMTSTLSSLKPLTYQRPESLEETPQDVDDFLRKNKMGGLIHKTSRRDKGYIGKREEHVEQPKNTQEFEQTIDESDSE